MATDRHYSVGGRGLCIIIANFVGTIENTSHLKGYVEDVRNLTTIFTKDLFFTVKTYVNLSRGQLEDRLVALGEFLKKEWKREGFDRLFVFLLSHGGQQGLCMCKEGKDGKFKERDSSGNYVYVPVDEIISHFTHKTVPVLEGVPKCFFIQACRGNSYMQVAPDTSDPIPGLEQDPPCEDDFENKCLSITGADIFVTHCTHEYTRCFVDDSRGSVFIVGTVNAMKENYKTADIFEIMTEVVSTLARQEHTRILACNNSSQDIKVLHNGDWCSFTVCGKIVGSDVDSDMPLVVQHRAGAQAYTGFISHENLTVDFSQHCLFGWVYLKKGMKKCFKLETLSPDQIKAFYDTSHFLMKGEVRKKENMALLAKGTITCVNGQLSAEGTITPIGDDERHNLNICVIIREDEETLNQYPVSIIKGREAKLYIDGHFHGRGYIQFGEDEDDETEVCCINTDVYQLPQITSTLRKRLYLVKSEKAAVTREKFAAMAEVQKMVGKTLSEWMDSNEKPSLTTPDSTSLDVGDKTPVSQPQKSAEGDD